MEGEEKGGEKKRPLPNVIDPMTKLVHMRAAKPKKQSYPHKRKCSRFGLQKPFIRST